jgi:hypothetical protein
MSPCQAPPTPAPVPGARYRRAFLRPLPGTEAWARCSPQGRQPLSLAERLWPKVWGPWYDDSIGPDDCWLWIGHAIDGWNYGRIHAPIEDSPRRLIGAHVAAYQLAVGHVPAGRLLRHVCSQHRCCNPSHLLPGSAAENSADIRAAGHVTGFRAHRRRRQKLAA